MYFVEPHLRNCLVFTGLGKNVPAVYMAVKMPETTPLQKRIRTYILIHPPLATSSLCSHHKLQAYHELGTDVTRLLCLVATVLPYCPDLGIAQILSTIILPVALLMCETRYAVEACSCLLI